MTSLVSISQTKRTVSVSKSDLAVYSKEYERLKIVAMLVPQYENKINQLTEWNNALEERVAAKQADSLLQEKRFAVQQQIIDNMTKADTAQKQEALEWKNLFEQAKRKERNARRVTVFVAIIGAATTGYFAAK